MKLVEASAEAILPVDFIVGVRQAFAARSRAIKHKGVTFEVCVVKQEGRGSEGGLSRAEYEFNSRTNGRRVIYRVIVWGDRWVWLDARQPSKAGWDWEFTIEGRLIAHDAPRELVRAVEKSLALRWSTPVEIVRALGCIWKPRLAAGPEVSTA